jgi:chaperonin GroEL
VVPGGGVALLRALPALAKIVLPADQKVGVQTVAKALEEPARMIAENAGAEGSVVVQKVKTGKGPWGYNAAKGIYEDLAAAGIIDPAKVTRCALQNAASVAVLVITTHAVITDKPEKEDDQEK